MKRFLLKVILAIFISFICIVGLLIVSSSLAKDSYTFDLPDSKTTFVVGDSHPTCAINDSILSSAINLSDHGTGYFYSYLKIRNYLNYNTQIDTIVIGYSLQDIQKERDDWFGGMSKIKKIEEYLFLMDLDDYTDLALAQPSNVISYTPKAIFHNLKLALGVKYPLGGFDYLKRDKLEEHKEIYQKEKTERVIHNTEEDFSIYQEKYLNKIYNLCVEKSIVLVLVHTPIHPTLLEGDTYFTKKYCSLYTKKFTKALLVDHSSLNIPEQYYADLGHLNYKGAEYYSKLLLKNGFKPKNQICN